MKTLLLVDIQRDFLPGGALPVPAGDEIIPVANRLMPHFDLVVASQDWHPPNHVSFASNHPGQRVGALITVDGGEQRLWPDHCVQGSPGACFAEGLATERIDQVFRKGIDPRIDSYSAFLDNDHRRSTGLNEYLKARGSESLFITGLALDVCVRFTVKDALALGHRAILVSDACRGMNPAAEIVEELRALGAEIIESAEVERRLERSGSEARK